MTLRWGSLEEFIEKLNSSFRSVCQFFELHWFKGGPDSRNWEEWAVRSRSHTKAPVSVWTAYICLFFSSSWAAGLANLEFAQQGCLDWRERNQTAVGLGSGASFSERDFIKLRASSRERRWGLRSRPTNLRTRRGSAKRTVGSELHWSAQGQRQDNTNKRWGVDLAMMIHVSRHQILNISLG